MTRRPRRRASATVSSREQSSTRRTSWTVPGGMSASVRSSVDAALYAGMTAMTRGLACDAGWLIDEVITRIRLKNVRAERRRPSVEVVERGGVLARDERPLVGRHVLEVLGQRLPRVRAC